MRLDYTDHAKADLIEIGLHIAQDDRRIAREFMVKLRGFIEALVDQATAYRIRSEWGANVRAVNFRGYMILFETNDEQVTILRVANGRRDILQVLRETGR